MLRKKIWQTGLLTCLLLLPLWAQRPGFNADSAYAYLSHLTENIGPRPMGSQNERRALQWTVDKFRAFGADTAYVMPFLEAPRGVNTTSGIAIGVFPGQSDSIIVVGGHIDTDSRINPGASDNASGTACVIELARNWGKAPGSRYTLVFAAFGGEERGLVGSKYFAEHYPRMDLVALMFSIDMASTPGWLIPFIDSKSHQAPRWLVEDAYAVDRALGYNDLDYPTHFFSINNAIGAAGSDHLPFLEKDIPAIDFTAGINIDPIHTPQDRIEFVDKRMLARSGRIVNAMLEKYQENGIPGDRSSRYMLWENFMGLQFIPKWLIFGVVVLGLAAGVGSILQARKFPGRTQAGGRFSGVKLFLLMIVIAMFTQAGEALLQLIKGFRYPWMIHFNQYLLYAGLWALGGIWVAAQATRRIRFSDNAFGYALRAVILLLLYTVLMFFLSARLALYPAVSLIILYLVINLRPAPLQLLAGLIMPLPMFRLMFMEALPLIARSLTISGFQLTTFSQALIYFAILTALLTLWYLPVLYTWAFLIRYIPQLQGFVEQFRRGIPGLVILIAIVGYGGYLAGLPVYNEKWKPLVRTEAKYNMNTAEATMTVRSNDFLRGINIQGVTLNRSIDDDVLSETLPVSFRSDWLSISRMDSLAIGEKDTVFINWIFGTTHEWYRAELTVKTDSGSIEPLIESVNYAKTGDNTLEFRWEADPATLLRVSGRLIIPPGSRLIREWKGIYPYLPMPITVTSAYGTVLYQTEVTLSDTLQPHAMPAPSPMPPAADSAATPRPAPDSAVTDTAKTDTSAAPVDTSGAPPDTL